MSTYQLQLLLEALAGVHSFEELSDGIAVISLLVRHFGFDALEAEAVVRGALELKTMRVEGGSHVQRNVYLQ